MKLLHFTLRKILYLIVPISLLFISCWDTTQTIEESEKNPKINLRAGVLEIPTASEYDFGSIQVGNSTSVTFTIENLGNTYLKITEAISISGDTSFSVVNQPNTSLPPYSYTDFQIQFMPTSEGEKIATITIKNNDPAKTTYSITIKGIGVIPVAPEIHIQYSGTDIINGSSVTLGSCNVDSSNDFTLTIQNVGTDNLAVNPVTISGIDSSLFSIFTQPSGSIAPSASTTFTIQFSPTSVGSKTAIISITNNDADENPYIITINATATPFPQPDIFIIQGSTPLYNGVGEFNFGQINQGQTSATVTFTIKNTGKADLNLNGISITGTDATMFAITSSPSTPVTANGTTTFDMTFTPSSEGEKTATISIDNNVPGKNPYTFTVKGTGVAIPEINIKQGGTDIDNNTSFDIGSTTVNNPKDIIFTIENLGVGTLILPSNPIISLTGSPFFSLTAIPSNTINPSSSSIFTFRYLPTEVGTHSTIVTIANNDLDENPYTFTVTALATSIATPKIQITKSSQVLLHNNTIDFGGMSVDGLPIDVTFTIKNIGDSNLTLSNVTLANNTAFTIVSSPTTPVTPGSTTNVTLRFTASNATAFTDTLTIVSNDSNNSPFVINLTGKGLNPEINCKINTINLNSGDTYDFGSVATGHSKDIIITIENLSASDPLYLTGIPIIQKVSGDADINVISQPTKTSIAPSGSTTFVIRFSPGSTGTKTAQFSIQNNDANENLYIINIQGNGTSAVIQVDEVANGGTINYGNVKCNSGGSLQTFTIRNNGSTNLLLNTSTPVIISGANKDLFILETSPSTTINPSSTSTFSIRFNPQTLADVGDKNAVITIQSNDASCPIYSFTVTGKGTTPHIKIDQGATNIANGSTFNFPNVNYGSAGVELIFTITNTGDAELLLTGTPKVLLSDPTHFQVTQQPSSPVAPSNTTTFKIIFNPTALGTHTSTVSIQNDTLNSNPFTFTIQGICDDTEAPTITITAPAANSYTNGTQDLVFTVSDNVGVTSTQAKIGTGTFTDITSPAAISSINGWASASEGIITIDIQAKDAANNTGTASLTLIKDITPPNITITGPAPDSYTNGSQLFTFTTSDTGVITSVQAKIGTGTYTDITSPAAISSINGWASASEGIITIDIQAKDAANNTGAASLTLIKDITPPTGNITSPADGTTVSGSIIITANASDFSGINYVEFYINNVLVSTVFSLPWQYDWDTTSYSNGSYPLKIRVVDKAGNEVTDDDTTVTVNN